MVFDNWLSRMLKRPSARSGRGRQDRPALLECCEERILLSGTGVLIDGGGAFDNFDQIALGDLDGNGTIDAFTMDSSVSSRVWLNDGSGAFVDTGQRLTDFSSTATNVELADLDNDGDLDAYTMRLGASSNKSPGRVWFNDGTGTFTDSGQRLGDQSSGAFALADLDGDSDIDVFDANSRDSDGQVLLNNGAGVLTANSQGFSLSKNADVALADVDSDGDLDAFLAVVNGRDRLLLNDGAGNFVDSGQSLSPLKSTAVVMGDVDGDGDMDAVIGSAPNLTSTSFVWLNDGSGSFSRGSQKFDLRQVADVALVDIDDDGDLDVLTADSELGTQPSRIWLNHGNGVFTESLNTLGSAAASSLGVADLDGDSDLDVVVLHSGEPATVWFNVDAPVPVEVNLPATSGTFELVRDGSEVVVRTQGTA